VQEYIINVDYTPTITIGRSPSCDITLKEHLVAPEHCSLVFEHGQFLLRNLNPAYGTFVLIDSEWQFSPLDNQLELMVGNHLVRIKENTQSCFGRQDLKLRIKNSQYV
jgi:predicted component of type VI protein secretion system